MSEQTTFDFNQLPVITGYPELRWTGKRPYTSTEYYPAQLRETYGKEEDGWMNKIFWGDNLQVMSHLLKEYRGKVDLCYIDPPFASKETYKGKIKIRGVKETVSRDSLSFEEKQYGDIWKNDEYLQFMYERLILIRELLSDTGSIYLHCDWHEAHHLRCLMDEVFGPNNFINEIIWHYQAGTAPATGFAKKHDSIFFYAKSKNKALFNVIRLLVKDESIYPYTDENGRKYRMSGNNNATRYYADEGRKADDVWTWLDRKENNIFQVYHALPEHLGYPTQKPEALLERILKASSNEGDLVFDCFMGSGTTQAVAMKMGRRFIGADINLGAIQTTTKRLLSAAKDLDNSDGNKYTGFEVFNVNNYDFFRNPVEAKDLLIEALEIQPFDKNKTWDGELDGRMVKIMPVNRIATKADLQGLIDNLPYGTYDKRKEEHPSQPVERITIVCMGHEPDLKEALEKELKKYKVDIEIVDILRDKQNLQLKRDAVADVVRQGNKLVIRSFYPMNLMQKLSWQKENVDEWRQLVDSVMIDWNFDGNVMKPAVTDVPERDELVMGIYDIPADAGVIKVKITDLLSESLEVEVR